MTSIDHIQGRDQTGTGVPFAEVFVPFNHRGEAAVTAIDGTLGFVARLVRAVALKARERATINALAELDDRTLSDIGVNRSEIHHIAGQLARNPGYNHYVANC